MNKHLGMAAVMALAGACTPSLAQDSGRAFVSAGLGQGQYHAGHGGPGYELDDEDIAGALRVGYAWQLGSRFGVGVEGGYVDLGESTSKFNQDYLAARSTFSVTGWMLGLNGKYHLAGKWYASARGGWLRSKAKTSIRVNLADFNVSSRLDGDANGDGWYGGVGLGYDIAPNLGIGLNYDNYHEESKVFASSLDHNVGTYMLTAEYRF